MSLRFFVDQCVPFSVVEILRNGDHEALILKDYIVPTSADPIVIAKAQELDAMLISLNGDFSDIVRYIDFSDSQPPELDFLGIPKQAHKELIIQKKIT